MHICMCIVMCCPCHSHGPIRLSARARILAVVRAEVLAEVSLLEVIRPDFCCGACFISQWPWSFFIGKPEENP